MHIVATSGLDADVLVIGAGPVGAALAGELGRWGVTTIVAEMTDGTVTDPRMHAVNIRSMEVIRRWGLTDALRNCGWPQDHPQDIVFTTGLDRHELARIPWPAISASRAPPCSPTFAQRCPQAWFNPIMHGFALSQPGVSIRWHSQVTRVTEEDGHVRAVLRAVDGGADSVLQVGFAVACDGARSETRTVLGIPREASEIYGHSAEAVFRAPALRRRLAGQEAGRYTFIGPDGVSASLLPFDGRDLFRMTLMAEPGQVTPKRMQAAITACIGGSVPYELTTGVLPWINREAVATRFRKGRVLIAGDAAHTMPPTGGFGYNTGLLDAVDLGWKLGAIKAGWGGPRLLDSYGTERGRAARRMARMAGEIYRDWFAVGPMLRTAYPTLLTEDASGAEARRRVGGHLADTFRREFNALGGALGYDYATSPIIVPDGTPPPPDLIETYVPTSRPGHLAPHVWIGDDLSTKDLFDRAFTLIDTGADPRARLALLAAADKMGLPLRLHGGSGPDLSAAYPAPLTLIRPDGHVAWRGEGTDDPLTLLHLVCGWPATARTPTS